MTLEEKCSLAEKAARASGEMLLTHPQTSARKKSDNDYVTEMDVASEELIRGILLSACPEDEFFGEEEGGSTSGRGRWIVDPIDGTMNFFRSNPLFTISIAYEKEGELVVGCVYCPVTNEMFTAVKGRGAFLNGRPVRVSDISVPRSGIMHISFCHRHPRQNGFMLPLIPVLSAAFSDLRRTGSAAYDLCCVASGRCECFFEPCLSIYDYAAGAVILREAGGTLTDIREGRDPLESGCIFATNTLLHPFMTELLSKGDLRLLEDE